DQRQANQRRGVFARHGVEQGDAEAFRLGAARTIERLFLGNVAADLVVTQVAKAHLGGNAFDLKVAGARVEQRQCGVKHHGLSAHALKLRDSARLGAGLAEDLTAQVSHLVAADDQRIRPARCDRACLFSRQALGGCRGGFAGQRRFIGFGAVGVERQMQAFEQHLAIRGGRSENEFHDASLHIGKKNNIMPGLCRNMAFHPESSRIRSGLPQSSVQSKGSLPWQICCACPTRLRRWIACSTGASRASWSRGPKVWSRVFVSMSRAVSICAASAAWVGSCGRSGSIRCCSPCGPGRRFRKENWRTTRSMPSRSMENSTSWHCWKTKFFLRCRLLRDTRFVRRPDRKAGRPKNRLSLR